ncbi:Nudix hydrolase 15, mitochondrial [Sesamum alatum]|uniref:Nudix hydrolase 15, mitochondrial n=1 Tax=Sesamum alatum TaxID=300844 RepID=A0AAE1Y7C9_9LAMI|nr:Nudix hydrolase 15, mitochondrial [Sesamum alatum]
MLPLLRRTSTALVSSFLTPSSLSPIQTSLSRFIVLDSCAAGPSRKLMVLAQQLRLYKPPPQSDDNEEEEQRIEESAGKVVSQVGFAESATSVARRPLERFRPKRAAVVICLFEGDYGELRTGIDGRRRIKKSLTPAPPHLSPPPPNSRKHFSARPGHAHLPLETKIHSEASVDKNAKEIKEYMEEMYWGSKKQVLLLGHNKGGVDVAAIGMN